MKRKKPMPYSMPTGSNDQDAASAENIGRRIGPALRAVYADVLKEDLPDDLLALVEQLRAGEQDSESPDSAAPGNKNGDGPDD
jgi:hypothetical protein